VLGVSTGEGNAKVPRPGLLFQENGAHIYDVEVLGLEIGDREIANQLLVAQRQTIQDALRLVTSRRNLAMAEEQEALNQKLEEIRATTTIQKVQLQKKVLSETSELTQAELSRDVEKFKTEQLVEVEKQKVTDIANSSEIQRAKLLSDQDLSREKEALALRLQEVDDETKNLAERMKAISPDLVVAMQRFGDSALVEKMADSMSPMALLGGKSVAEVLGKLLQGTGLEKLVTGIALGSAPSLLGSGNGSGNRMTSVKS
jgi:major vault protein